METDRRKGDLLIKIIHLDSTKECFNSPIDDACFLDNYDTQWKKFNISTVPATWLNDPVHQGVDFDEMDDAISRFIEFEVWNYSTITIAHEFEKE